MFTTVSSIKKASELMKELVSQGFKVTIERHSIGYKLQWRK